MRAHDMQKDSKIRLAASGIAPLALTFVLAAYLLGPGSQILDLGVPLPEVTIERIDFAESEIRATVRNTGTIPVEIAVADVNDRIQPAAIEPDKSLERYETAVVRIPYEWNVAEPYVVGVTTDDGTRFERAVEAAAPALEPGWELAASFAVIGTFVGVVPVIIGMLWLPFVRRLGSSRYGFFLALTAGLLLFLAIDSTEEALEISSESIAGSFNGVLLISTVVLLSFLGLYYASGAISKSKSAGPAAVALMVAVGIGLHNFGEGLAIGASVVLGSAAFSAFLIVGFALHNTTEGLAIAAPASKARTSLLRLGGLAAVAGTPAIFGAWMGGFAYSPFASVIFLSVGTGAILQVIALVLKWMRDEAGGLSSGAAAAGFAAGMLVMYLTSILV